MDEKCIRPLQPDERIITMCPQMIVPPMNYAARSLRLRVPRICVSITGSEPAELLEMAETVLRENTLLEFRLDYLKAPLTAMAKLRRLMEARPDAIVIATCRRTVAGGKFHGSLGEELEVLHKAAEAGCPAMDVPIESAEETSCVEWEEFVNWPPLCSPAMISRAAASWKRRLSGCLRLARIFTR